MRAALLCLFLVACFGFSCSKNGDDFVTGRVEIKAGCFDDSWLVSIDNPDAGGKHPFLRETTSGGTLYNCSNAVFINLPSSLAEQGTRIRFKFTDAQIFSCLSYSEAPTHIKVKNLSRVW